MDETPAHRRQAVAFPGVERDNGRARASAVGKAGETVMQLEPVRGEPVEEERRRELVEPVIDPAVHGTEMDEPAPRLDQGDGGPQRVREFEDVLERAAGENDPVAARQLGGRLRIVEVVQMGAPLVVGGVEAVDLREAERAEERFLVREIRVLHGLAPERHDAAAGRDRTEHGPQCRDEIGFDGHRCRRLPSVDGGGSASPRAGRALQPKIKRAAPVA